MLDFFLFGGSWAVIFFVVNLVIGLVNDSRTPLPICEWLVTPRSAEERLVLYTEELAGASYDIRGERQRRKHVSEAVECLHNATDLDREA